MLIVDNCKASDSQQRKKVITSAPASSSINYNWHHKDNVLELGIGLTCCPKPKEKDLQRVWDRTRPALVGLLNSLQGIHVYVSNLDGRSALIGIEEDLPVLSVGPEGHLWHLMSNGTFTVTLTVEGFMPMTKLVRVFAAEFTEVNFELPYPAGIPRAVTVLILTSIILVLLLCMLVSHYRGGPEGKKTVRSYEGFQLLSRDERHIFEDMTEEMDEEDDFEFFDKIVEQFGLKMPPSKVYRDFTSSSDEETEDFLKISRQQPL